MAAEALRANGMTPETPVWRPGLQDWTPAGQLPELQPYFAQTVTEEFIAVETPEPRRRFNFEKVEQEAVAVYKARINGVEIGPKTAAELIQIGVKPDTPVLGEGFVSFVPAGTLDDFAVFFNNMQANPTYGPPTMPYPPQPSPYQQPYARQPYGQQPPMSRPAGMSMAIVATVLGIFSCIGLILGIIAITQVNQATRAWDTGQYDNAQRAASTARTLSIIALVVDGLGLLINVFYMSFMGALGSFGYY